MSRSLRTDDVVLVTGATGFVGSRLVAALRPRVDTLRALVRPTSDSTLLHELGAELVVGDLRQPTTLASAVAGADVVLHLGALTRARTRDEYFAANARGTEALLEAMLGQGRTPRRLVYLSSMAAAGPSLERPVGPFDTPRPLTAYGESKLAGEAAALAGADDVEVVILRPPAVYGPGDRDLLTFFRLAARGLLPVPTGPDRPVQLIHVDDLAEALIRAAGVPGAHGVYHVADPGGYPWVHVANLVADSVGVRARVVRVPGGMVRAAAALVEGAAGMMGKASIFNRDKARELLAPGWLCDTTRAERELGFRASIPLAEGLAGTAEWYRARGWL